jgi:hypothetical protein
MAHHLADALDTDETLVRSVTVATLREKVDQARLSGDMADSISDCPSASRGLKLVPSLLLHYCTLLGLKISCCQHICSRRDICN